jgi:arsenite methyltransferase
MEHASVKEVVKQKYGEAALRVHNGGSSCCGATAASALACDPITSNLYDKVQQGEVPDAAVLASLGCGNPTALAQFNHGETVRFGIGRRTLTCCSRQRELVPPVKLTAWI